MERQWLYCAGRESRVQFVVFDIEIISWLYTGELFGVLLYLVAQVVLSCSVFNRAPSLSHPPWEDLISQSEAPTEKRPPKPPKVAFPFAERFHRRSRGSSTYGAPSIIALCLSYFLREILRELLLFHAR
ncbi:hypothetical protein KQX54_015046 [Cotesia glomerata]|uniref:Uncharacterized protein n=1 Tax=Cotesia glomerata TaxID=32391 RepID=A0AAV7IUE4_COTGL|nr:hypothetical protein KQX54_015046 [Cotesia glomerata]